MSKPEKKLQDKAIAYLRKQNIYYINQFGDGFTGKGKPDLVTCINGRFVAFELKVGKNNLQDDQVIHKRRIERSNGLHYAPYTIEEFIEIVEELQNGY
ncbi:MAG: VRR-NUC domain-containing protein [Peptostreptococcus sp.]|uniref:VRR-NUC domain-containing protein n=1 Tax=Peptostreptococcus sp. TaxID=1262 RepID=UPI001D64F966|nr:VRR-NUC domain-containing protein [Peptostreptococcus sp.]MBS5596871.1 VRR-NUC domain-containing protein [Peptostreptococcus sp.]MDU5351089.1 VRR-NUC domain-containing protein [Peptostreptococcus sp.]MDU5891889.1 VRR-NUC domain-containing protein [Peptostreptococcus sp.]